MKSAKITILILITALIMLYFGCNNEGKGEDTEPEVNDDSSDLYSNYAVPKGTIEIGTPINGTFDNSSYHLYNLSITGDSAIKISLQGVNDPSLDTVLRVYGPRDSNGLLPSKRIAYDDDSGGNYSSLIGSILLTKGEYAIVASTFNGNPAEGETYLLSAECIEGACAESQVREINIEVDRLSSQIFPEEVKNKVNEIYAKVGIHLVFHDDENIDPADYPEELAYYDYKALYFDHFNHRGEKGWHYMVLGDLLQGGNRGWGRLGGDMFIISSNWIENVSEENWVAAQANIILHEFGHNMGLEHVWEDSEIPHVNTSCAMPVGVADPPFAGYCDLCYQRINPDTTAAW